MIACPGCGGNLKFDIGYQNLHCSYCDAHYDPYQFDSKKKDGEEHKSYETTIFTCPECAGEIASTDNEVTGFCPFCGGSTIFYQRLSNELKPDFIIPFKKSKEDCKQIYQKKASKLLFLPSKFKKAQYIDGFRGIYIPYWSYNVSQTGELNLKGSKTHRSGDYVITEHYNLTGEMNNYYNGIGHDASSSLSDDISERIAPFNVHEKEKFTAGFLSGFYADTADVDSSVYKNDAIAFAAHRTTDEIRNVNEFKGYSPEISADGNYNGRITEVERVMYPVWFMSYRNKDAIAYATVNGQTGKVVADFPIDLKKFFAFTLALALLLFIPLNMFFTFKPTVVSGINAFLSAISLFMYLAEQNAINKKSNPSFDRGYLYMMKKTKRWDQDDEAKNHKKIKGTYRVIPIAASIIAIIISAIMAVSGSIHDELHYSVALVSTAFMAITLIYLILDYNKLIMRPLPQFRKKGGDDAA